jgi:hypothetical protein
MAALLYGYAGTPEKLMDTAPKNNITTHVRIKIKTSREGGEGLID